jgi:hypothetical protein
MALVLTQQSLTTDSFAMGTLFVRVCLFYTHYLVLLRYYYSSLLALLPVFHMRCAVAP